MEVHCAGTGQEAVRVQFQSMRGIVTEALRRKNRRNAETMRKVKERLEDFKNMISVVDNIYLTTLNSNYDVIETNCPNQNFLAVIFVFDQVQIT